MTGTDHSGENVPHAVNARLLSALRVAGLGTIEWNPFSGEVAWSPEFYELVGRNPEEMPPTEESFIAVLHPDDLEFAQQITDDIQAGRTTEAGHDYRIIRPNNDIRVLRSTTAGLFDDDGNLESIIATFIDVTPERENLQLLEESEQRFRDITEIVTDMVMEMDEDGIVTYVSPSANIGELAKGLIRVGTNYGDEADKLIEGGATLIEPVDGPAVFQAREPFFNFRSEWHLADGTREIWNRSGVPIRDAAGNFRGFRIALRDVTDETTTLMDLQEAQEISHLGNWRTLDDILVINCSAEMCRIFGLKTDNLQRDTEEILALIYPEDLERVTRETEEHRQGKRGHLDTEYRINRANDGEMRWVHSRSSVINDADGKAIGTIGTVQDVTERHQILEELQTAERRFQEVADASLDLAWETNQDHEIIYLSDNVTTLTGADPSEVIGLTLWGWDSQNDDSTGWDEIIDKFQSHASFSEVRIAVTNRGNTLHWSNSGNPMFDDKDRFTGFRGFSRDITQRVQARRDIRRSEAQLQAIMDNASIGIATINNQGILQSFNPEAQAIFGLSEADVLGKNVSMLMGDADASNHDNYIRQYLETGKGRLIGLKNRRVTARHRDEHDFPIEISITEMEVDGEQQFIGSFYDVTQKIADERRYQQAQKMEAVGQMTGGIAHDFNNLLAAMMLNIELLEDETTGNSDARRYLRTVLTSVERGAALTNRLLAFARQQDLDTVRFDINQRINSLVPLLRQTMPENIEIIADLQPSEIVVDIDPHQFESAMLNLALNARDAMLDGGTLSIATSVTELGEQELTSNENAVPGTYIRIEVRDSGHGMPPEIVDRIVDPFFTTKKHGKGTGLGLSMVYGFVTQSGGHFQVESTPGDGAMFSLYFPSLHSAPIELEAASQPTDDAAENTPTKATRPAILVVEDNEDILAIVTNTLKSSGFDAFPAADGQQAEAWLRDTEVPPQLLVSDITLPGNISGFDIGRRVREKHPVCQYIFMTGYSNLANTDLSDFPENTVMLHKPFAIRALLDAVKDILPPSTTEEPVK